MAKRFTSTDKWRDPWYRKLPYPYRDFWQYILDNCDNAGIWVKDIETAAHFVGGEINEAKAIEYFNAEKERIKTLNGGSKWEVIDYIEFQFGNLTPNNPLHNSIIQLIERYKARGMAGVFKGYASPSSKGKGISKGNSKGKEKKQPAVKPDFLPALKANPAYKHIDIDNELNKMDAWLMTHPGRQKTQRFVVNWLNKIDKPIGITKRQPAQPVYTKPTGERFSAPPKEFTDMVKNIAAKKGINVKSK